MIKHNLEAIILFIGALFVAFLLSEVSHANVDKSIFINKCAKCHNINPTKPGSIGPDIAGSSLELVTLKTQKREYPKNYKPKRKTKIMPIVKLTIKEIQQIHNYLNSFIKK